MSMAVAPFHNPLGLPRFSGNFPCDPVGMPLRPLNFQHSPKGSVEQAPAAEPTWSGNGVQQTHTPSTARSFTNFPSESHDDQVFGSLISVSGDGRCLSCKGMEVMKSNLSSRMASPGAMMSASLSGSEWRVVRNRSIEQSHQKIEPNAILTGFQSTDEVLVRWMRKREIANVNEKRMSGRRVYYPLHLAIRKERPDIAKFLLMARADPRKEDSEGMTALDLAMEHNKDRRWHEIIWKMQ